MGAKSKVLPRAAAAADVLPPNEWFGRVYVDRAGRISRTARSSCAWSIDLGECAAPPRQLALV
jgi:hypothetical protein